MMRQLWQLWVAWLYGVDCRAWVDPQPGAHGYRCARTRHHFGEHRPC